MAGNYSRTDMPLLVTPSEPVRQAQGKLRESRGLSGEIAEPSDGTCEDAERLRR